MTPENKSRELFEYQRPPSFDDHSWDVFMLLGGRGIGKTLTGATLVREHLHRLGARARVGCGAPTIGDARDTMAEGDTGLITLYGNEFKYNRSLGEARHYLGGYVKFQGSEKPARWNGPQWSMLWADELALWKHDERNPQNDSYSQAQFGLRLGEHPRTIITTTPKSKAWVKAISEDDRTIVKTATTFDNPALDTYTLQRLRSRYEGTRLGDQELMGLWVMEVPGALWSREWIDDSRLEEVPPYVELVRLVTAVDPSGTKGGDEVGLAVAGLGSDGEYYVFTVHGVHMSPHGWARRAIGLYMGEYLPAFRDGPLLSDRLVAERNFGGDMVEATIRQAIVEGEYVNIETIFASRGKVARAEPIANLYEQGRVHHIGRFPEAEEQMCQFPIENENDDLVDADVWALTTVLDAHGSSASLINKLMEPEAPAVRDDYNTRREENRRRDERSSRETIVGEREF